MESRGPELASVTIVFLVTSWFFVSLRIFTRTRLIKSFGTDDWLITVALLLFTIYASSILASVSHGMGKHVSDLTAQQFTEAMKAWWFAELFYVTVTCALKLSIGCFLLRVTTNNIHIYLIWTVMALSLIYGIYMFFLIIFQCLPTSFFWDKDKNGHCISPIFFTNSTYGHAAVLSLTDWTYSILPVFIMHNLQMNRRTKISVILLLCVANVGSITTLIRIKYIYDLSITKDFTFVSTDISVWSSIELGIGIAAASIATFRPLFRSFFSMVGSYGSRNPMPLQQSEGHQHVDEFDMQVHSHSPTVPLRVAGGNPARNRSEKEISEESLEMQRPWPVKSRVEVISKETHHGEV